MRFEIFLKNLFMKRKFLNQFPPGWDERRVRKVIEHYDNQTDEEAAAELEAFDRRANELRRQKLSEIVKERLRLEESLIRGLKKNAANGNNKKRRAIRKTSVVR